MRKTYKLRSNASGNKKGHYDSCSIGVPGEIVALLRAKGIDEFEVHLTDEGILYSPPVPDAAKQLPEWLKP